jgi:sugar-phosphatase
LQTKAVIFDLDGLLIDSEPFWRVAEKEALGRVGIAMTDEMCEMTMGWRTRDVVEYWHARFPWRTPRVDAVGAQILRRVEELVRNEGAAMNGVYETLGLLRTGGYLLAIASSSPMSLIDAVLDRLAIWPLFQAVSSAADEEQGKPHPAVYLTAAKRLRQVPRACVALEDSVAGVRSARAAGMRTIAVPAPHLYDDPRFGQADVKLRTLQEFRLQMLG